MDGHVGFYHFNIHNNSLRNAPEKLKGPKSCPRVNKRPAICQLTLSAWAHGGGQTGTLHRHTRTHTQTHNHMVCVCVSVCRGPTCARWHVNCTHTSIRTLIEGGSCYPILPGSCSFSTLLLVLLYFTSRPENHTEYTIWLRETLAVY